VDISNTEFLQPKASSPQFSVVPNDDLQTEEISDTKPAASLRSNSHDPNLTLISLYTPDIPPNIQINVQRSSSSAAASKSSQLFSLFRIPKRENTRTSSPNNQLSETVDETVVDKNSNTTKPIVDISEKRKQDKKNRFISFFRYIFCQLLPTGSNAIVTPAIDNQTIEDNQVLSTVKSKVK